MITLRKIADFLSASIKGDENCVITGIAPLQTAQPGQISFLDNPRYRQYLQNTQASAVILAPNELENCYVNALVLDNPYLGYAKVTTLFEKKSETSSGIHPTVVQGRHCRIHPTASIGPYCVIGNEVEIGANVVLSAHCVVGDRCKIGEATHFWPRVTLYHDIQIGERVIIHSGAVLGSDGFGFANEKGQWRKISQLGSVIIGHGVEIGANTTIDRGALGDTIIDEGVKLDNQIQIAHNVHIGAHTAIAGCVGISGSTSIGKYCMIGGGTCISGHLKIADKTVVTGMAMVTHSLTEPGVYSSGTGITTNAQWQKNAVRFRHLDDMAKRLRAIEKELEKK